jgi:hypothetical protein
VARRTIKRNRKILGQLVSRKDYIARKVGLLGERHAKLAVSVRDDDRISDFHGR